MQPLADGGLMDLGQLGDLGYRQAFVRQAHTLQAHPGAGRQITFVQPSPQLDLLLRREHHAQQSGHGRNLSCLLSYTQLRQDRLAGRAPGGWSVAGDLAAVNVQDLAGNERR